MQWRSMALSKLHLWCCKNYEYLETKISPGLPFQTYRNKLELEKMN